MFKLIGIVAGYYFLGFWGVLLGFFVGSFIDRVRAYGSGGMNPLQNVVRQAVFLETVFISMGKLAKADGHVSQDEIDHVEQFMQKLGMSAGASPAGHRACSRKVPIPSSISRRPMQDSWPFAGTRRI